MASPAKIGSAISLDEFLRDPRLDEHPYLEFIDGQVEAKVPPQSEHAFLTKRIVQVLDGFADPSRLGESFPELRCTFEGRSIVPDIVFLLARHIEVDKRGRLVNDIRRPPDIHVEIISPKQSIRSADRKLRHSTAHGCGVGVLVNPEQDYIQVYRHGGEPERLAKDGAIDFAPVLPGLTLPVAEVFGWLIYRPPTPGTASE
jgi:Uma2 family endonuclease